MECTQVAEPLLSPVQYKQGKEGGFYLNWLGCGCFLAKSDVPEKLFLLTKLEGEKQNVQVPSVPLPKFAKFSSR
jgi:hypothetical protein